MTHEVKTDPLPFEHRWNGEKPWEIRLNDRSYAVGDYLHEREYNVETKRFSGRSILSRIVLIYTSNTWKSVPKNHVIMTLDTISQGARVR